MTYLQKQVSLYMLSSVEACMKHFVAHCGPSWPISVIECADRLATEIVALQDALLAVKVTQ